MSDFKTKKPLYKPVKSTKQGKKMMVYVKGSIKSTAKIIPRT